MEILLLETCSSDDDYNGDCDIAAIPLTQDLLKCIRRMHRLARQVKRRLHDFRELAVVSFTATFLSYADATALFGEVNLPNGLPTLVTGKFPTLDDHRQSVDYPRLCMIEDDVWWEGVVRHTSVRIATLSVPINHRYFDARRSSHQG